MNIVVLIVLVKKYFDYVDLYKSELDVTPLMLLRIIWFRKKLFAFKTKRTT